MPLDVPDMHNDHLNCYLPHKFQLQFNFNEIFSLNRKVTISITINCNPINASLSRNMIWNKNFIFSSRKQKKDRKESIHQNTECAGKKSLLFSASSSRFRGEFLARQANCSFAYLVCAATAPIRSRTLSRSPKYFPVKGAMASSWAIGFMSSSNS